MSQAKNQVETFDRTVVVPGMVNIEKLRRSVARITGGDFSVYEGYSGRCMFGAKAALAVVTRFGPQTKEGKRLLKKFRVDNMGLDYVYYTSEAAQTPASTSDEIPQGAGNDADEIPQG